MVVRFFFALGCCSMVSNSSPVLLRLEIDCKSSKILNGAEIGQHLNKHIANSSNDNRLYKAYHKEISEHHKRNHEEKNNTILSTKQSHRMSTTLIKRWMDADTSSKSIMGSLSFPSASSYKMNINNSREKSNCSTLCLVHLFGIICDHIIPNKIACSVSFLRRCVVALVVSLNDPVRTNKDFETGTLFALDWFQRFCASQPLIEKKCSDNNTKLCTNTRATALNVDGYNYQDEVNAALLAVNRPPLTPDQYCYCLAHNEKCIVKNTERIASSRNSYGKYVVKKKIQAANHEQQKNIPETVVELPATVVIPRTKTNNVKNKKLARLTQSLGNILLVQSLPTVADCSQINTVPSLVQHSSFEQHNLFTEQPSVSTDLVLKPADQVTQYSEDSNFDGAVFDEDGFGDMCVDSDINDNCLSLVGVCTETVTECAPPTLQEFSSSSPTPATSPCSLSPNKKRKIVDCEYQPTATLLDTSVNDVCYAMISFNETFSDITEHEQSYVNFAQQLIIAAQRPHELVEMCHIREPLVKDKQWERHEEMWFAVLFQLTQLHYDKSAVFKFNTKSPAHRRYLGERGHVHLMHDVFRHLTESLFTKRRLMSGGKSLLDNFKHQNKHDARFECFKGPTVGSSLVSVFKEGYSTERSNKQTDRCLFSREIELQALVKFFGGKFSVMLVDTQKTLAILNWVEKSVREATPSSNKSRVSKPQLLLLSDDGLHFTFWRNLSTVAGHYDLPSVLPPVSILQHRRPENTTNLHYLLPNTPLTAIQVRHKSELILPPPPPPTATTTTTTTTTSSLSQELAWRPPPPQTVMSDSAQVTRPIRTEEYDVVHAPSAYASYPRYTVDPDIQFSATTPMSKSIAFTTADDGPKFNAVSGKYYVQRELCFRRK